MENNTRHVSKQNILTKRQNLIGYFHALGILLLNIVIFIHILSIKTNCSKIVVGDLTLMFCGYTV
jgi:uncharacterized membrane protein YccF (DUF307 family)